MNAREFFYLVSNMRNAQNEYFKTLEEKAAKGDESARQAVVRNRKLYEQYSNDNS